MKQQVLSSHIRLPSLRDPAPGGQPPECLALNASRAYFPETQKAMGNRDSTFKGTNKNLTHSEPKVEAVM